MDSLGGKISSRLSTWFRGLSVFRFFLLRQPEYVVCKQLSAFSSINFSSSTAKKILQVESGEEEVGKSFSALDIKLKSSTEQLNFHSVIVAKSAHYTHTECEAS